jgi:SAM-dependent methyltransferase
VSCRICGAQTRQILDLGESPPANALLNAPGDAQESFPLVLELCELCGNLQLRDCLDAAALYRHYLYTTPDSQMLRKHYQDLYGYLSASRYIGPDSFVLEVGSNVGLLLQYLKPQTRQVLGIDPAVNICKLAQDSGIDTVCDFFDRDSAGRIRASHGVPDLIIARHCMAHNADPHVMVAAAAELLGDSAHLVIENAYGLNTVENNEFDQIYHEHMFYFTIRSMKALLAYHRMHLVSIFMSAVHGGSIVFVAKRLCAGDVVDDSVQRYSEREERLLSAQAFARFSEKARQIRAQLRSLVDELTAHGKSIFTYGATAKGNTLLNYVGLTHEQIRHCVDSTPIKQGKFLPKSGIEVVSEEQALASPPDFFLLTAWNYQDEIIGKVRRSGNHHSRFIIPIPHVHIL